MKKIYIILTSLFVVCFIIYTALCTHSRASNNSRKFEYYYNDKALAEDSLHMESSQTNTSTTKQNEMVIKLPDKIDKKPGSITVLVNKEYTLPDDYIPKDLTVPDIPFDFAYNHEKKFMRKDAADAIEDLFEAAEKENLSLYAISGYRSYARQKEIYTHNIRTKGFTYTSLVSAKPGSSEHQTGLAMDVSCPSLHYELDDEFSQTQEGIWLASNAHRYGFIIRYPFNKSDTTGYSYEPWHIRYVGTAVATYLYKNELTLEEYYNYKPSKAFLEKEDYGTAVDVDESNYKIDTKKVTSTPTPMPTAKPTATPTPTPTVTPQAEASVEPQQEEFTPSPTSDPLATEVPVVTQTPNIQTPVPLATEAPIPALTPEVTVAPATPNIP